MIIFALAVFSLSFFSFQFLSKPSIYRRDPSKKCIWDHRNSHRSLSDAVVLSNSAYLVTAVISFWLGQYYSFFLQILVFTASSVYHLNRESMYFNADCTYACALLSTFVWSLIKSYYVDIIYFQVCTVGLTIALFLFQTCGMPAEIKQDSRGFCTRHSRGLYESIHTMWHLVTALGPLLSSYFFTQYCLDENKVMCLGYFDDQYGKNFPVVPSFALFIGLSVTVLGNVVGIMPVD